jgi:ribonuclease D
LKEVHPVAAKTAPVPEIITTQQRLDDYCAELADAKRFAFDTEFIRDDTFHAHLALVQVIGADTPVLVDPTVGLKLDVFWALVTDPEITTIVHAGKEDLDLCLRETGQVSRNVFDVQIAAGFVGYGYPLSLSRLVEAVRRKRISKGATLTDWLRRPLTPEQVRYAVNDVLHLPAIHMKLADKLAKSKRTGWADEEFRRFEDPEFYRPPAEDRLFKIKGAKKLDAEGLMVLARLIDWRDEWAAERNRPVRALIRDDILTEIARRRPTKADELQVLRGFPQAKNKQVVQKMLDLIKEARAVPKSKWPVPHERRDETQMMRAVTDLLSAVLRARCCEEGVSSDLVGSSARLRELVDYSLGRLEERPALLTGWRETFVGGELMRILDGGGEVHLSGWPKQPHLEIVPTPRGRPTA